MQLPSTTMAWSSPGDVGTVVSLVTGISSTRIRFALYHNSRTYTSSMCNAVRAIQYRLALTVIFTHGVVDNLVNLAMATSYDKACPSKLLILNGRLFKSAAVRDTQPRLQKTAASLHGVQMNMVSSVEEAKASNSTSRRLMALVHRAPTSQVPRRTLRAPQRQAHPWIWSRQPTSSTITRRSHSQQTISRCTNLNFLWLRGIRGILRTTLKQTISIWIEWQLIVWT